MSEVALNAAIVAPREMDVSKVSCGRTRWRFNALAVGGPPRRAEAVGCSGRRTDDDGGGTRGAYIDEATEEGARGGALGCGRPVGAAKLEATEGGPRCGALGCRSPALPRRVAAGRAGAAKLDAPDTEEGARSAPGLPPPPPSVRIAL